jgi:hypothetical protein
MCKGSMSVSVSTAAVEADMGASVIRRSGIFLFVIIHFPHTVLSRCIFLLRSVCVICTHSESHGQRVSTSRPGQDEVVLANGAEIAADAKAGRHPTALTL